MISRNKLILLYERLLAKYFFYENLLNDEIEAVVNERMDELSVLLKRKQRYLEFLASIRAEITDVEDESGIREDQRINALRHEVDSKLKQLCVLQDRNKDELSKRLGELSERISQHHLTRTRVAAYKSNK